MNTEYRLNGILIDQGKKVYSISYKVEDDLWMVLVDLDDNTCIFDDKISAINALRHTMTKDGGIL